MRTLDLIKNKSLGKKISMLTCYDSAFAKLINHSDIDVVLVGDSVGNVMLGFKNTIPVTVDDMIHHCAAVARSLSSEKLLVCDLPFMSYKISKEQALTSTSRIIQDGGAAAVKLEGASQQNLEIISAIVDSGIPVMGHIGLTPQSVHALGGYKIQGKISSDQSRLLDEAKKVEDAGAFALVLELLDHDLAEKISSSLTIPTIGIGSGPACDGQVLVIQDMLGFDEDFNPKFLKKYANLGAIITSAIKKYDEEVKASKFPARANVKEE